MDDQTLSSICKDPTSYCTFDEQEKARTVCGGPQRIFRDRNTYIHMVIPVLQTHSVAVQVTISPFSLQQHPKQTFFSSRVRYGPCCCQINDPQTSFIVRNTVQNVIDCFYQPFAWNYSLVECCTVDHPTNTDIEQCTSVAISIFQTYAQDHSIVTESFTHGQLATTERSSSQSNVESLDPSYSTNTNALPSQRHTVNNHNSLTGANCLVACPELQSSSAKPKRKVGNGPTEESPPKRQRMSKEESDAKFVRSTAGWLKHWVMNLSAKDFPKVMALSEIPLSGLENKADDCAEFLWQWAEAVKGASTSIDWFARFMAACFSLAGMSFTAPSADLQPIRKCRFSHMNWRNFAIILNSIVNEMLLLWGDQAYLLYHIFAAEGQILSKVARLSEERRNAFVSGVVDELKKLTLPSSIEGVILFDPTRILVALLPIRSRDEIYEAIGLPAAITSRTIEGGRSFLQIPQMSTLRIRLGQYDRFLTSPLTPPTTPPVLQQEHTIDTDFTTGECNTDDNASSTITNLSVGSAQAGPSHLTCSAGGSMLNEAAGIGLSGGSEAETDNIGDPMLSNLSASDWDWDKAELFQPSDYDPVELWQSPSLQPGDPDLFPTISFET